MRPFPLLVVCLAVAGCSVTLGYEGLEGTRPADQGAGGGSGAAGAGVGGGAGLVGNAGAGANASSGASGNATAGTGGVGGGDGGASAGKGGASGGMGGASGGTGGASGGAGSSGGGAGGAKVGPIEDIFLAPAGDYVAGFTVDATHVYWTTGSALWRLPLANITGGPSLPTPQKMSGVKGIGKGRPWTLVRLGERVYWTDDFGNICSAAKDATDANCDTPLFASKETKPTSPAHALAPLTLGGKRYLISAVEENAVQAGSPKAMVAFELNAAGDARVGEPIQLWTFGKTSLTIAAGNPVGGSGLVVWADSTLVYDEPYASVPKTKSREPRTLLDTVYGLALSPEATSLAIGTSTAVYVKTPVPDLAPDLLYEGLEAVQGVAFPGQGLPDTIFVCESARGIIRALPVGGPKTSFAPGDLTTHTIISDQKEIFDVQTSGPYLYWFTSGAGLSSYLRRAFAP